jgi:hypothetical protein
MNRVAFGIIDTWPGGPSAEREVIARIERAAQAIGVSCVPLSCDGAILDSDHRPTGSRVDPNDLLFIVTVHYEDPKLLDCFYYSTLWNPPGIPLRLSYYDRLLDNYLMADDYLLHDSAAIRNHLSSVLLSSPRDIEGCSGLLPSCPAAEVLEPRSDSANMLFYCGMNWEVLTHGSKGRRHNTLMRLLDDTGHVRIFGPRIMKAWGGIRPWKGFKSYRGEIPFDGTSILREINECGIALALSSELHRRAGAATDRIFEACAAGAVIIADDNAFIQEHFGDSVLYVKYNQSDATDNFNQIMEKYEWIRGNPAAALEMARSSQKIFLERFALETQIRSIVANHPARKDAVARKLYAKRQEDIVLVVHVVSGRRFDEDEEKKLANVIENVGHQTCANIVLAVACDDSAKEDVQRYCAGKALGGKLVVVADRMYDEKQNRLATRGQLFDRVVGSVSHQYVMIAGPDEIWFADHVTSLVRQLEDDESIAAVYSGRVREERDRTRSIDQFQYIYMDALYRCEALPSPGQVMVRADAERSVPSFAYECIDGLEHYALLLCAYYRSGGKIEFSKRATFACSLARSEPDAPWLPREGQVRFIQGLVKHKYARERSIVSNSVHAGFGQLLKEAVQGRVSRDGIVYRALRGLYRLVVGRA